MAKGPLRVVTNEELDAQKALDDEEAQAGLDYDSRMAESALANHVRSEFERYRWERSKQRLNVRYLANLRAYNGQYSPEKLAEIKKFGGSDVFARITTTKCRGATSLLRDVYLGGERPWHMFSTPVPDVPVDVKEQVDNLVATEAQSAAMLGQPVDELAMSKRAQSLMTAARRAAKKQADENAKQAGKKIEDILVEGGFYTALHDFLIDLPIFPFACIKGPEVKNTVEIQWENKKIVQKTVPRMFWRRVSPFDLFFSPEADDAASAQVIERVRLRRNDLNQLIGVPGYNEENIRKVLNEFPHGYVEAIEDVEAERANQESRENPTLNRSDMYDSLEFHGYVRGQWLLDYGFTKEQIKDKDMDYSVVCWLVANQAIKVHINPNPKQGHPYYVTSFEKIPGSLYGNALPETLSDLQDVSNATLRSLVNNLSISSGPQVMINEERLSASTNGDDLYPWKRWRFTSDPMGDNTPPVQFFQPQSNSLELLNVYKSMAEIADEVSAIPRYVTGSEKVGGAASTASGLSMLMNNVAKVLQNVAAGIDGDVLQPALSDLYTMLLLTNPEPYFNGDSKVMVRGVAVAMQKETERMRKLEMLNLTANPMDAEIIGKTGRAALLRDIADELGMPGDKIIPDEDELKAQEEAMQQQQQQQMLMQQAAQAQGGQSEAPHNNTSGRMTEEFDNQHLNRYNN